MNNNISTEQSVQKHKRIPLNVRFSELFKYFIYFVGLDLWNFINSKMKFWYSKKTIAYFNIIAYLILYNESFRKLYESLIVKIIFEPLTSDGWKDAFFILLLAYLTFYFIVLFLRSFKLNCDFIIIFSLLTLLYSFYRYFGNYYWIFYGFSFCQNIKYADIIFVIEFFIILIRFKPYISYKKTQQKEESTFLVDEPIEEDGDSLNREKPAEELAKMIAGIKNENNSFAIGIIAPWGSGKTSFLNLIKKHLKNKGKILIHYNPWYNNTPKAIIQDFFEVLKNAVKPFSSQLSNEIFTYANKLSELNSSNASKVFKEIVSTIDDKGTVEEQYEKINKGLKEIHKQIIIFIDDLDRLDKPEIIEVIRLIRNTANFSNVIFVVAYDRNYVVKALEEINPHNVDIFLQKIFTIEFVLPHIDTSKIYQELESILKNKIGKKYYDELSKIIYDDYTRDYFNNLRDVKRFTNLFLSSFLQIQNEVEFKDYFKIQLIKYKYPNIFNFIYEKRKKIFKENAAIYVFNNKPENILVKELKNYIEKDAEIILQNIEKLFTKETIRHKELAIYYEYHFHKYFTDSLFPKDLSDDEFNQAINSDKFPMYLKTWADDDKIHLAFNKLRNRNINLKEFENTISALRELKLDKERIIELIESKIAQGIINYKREEFKKVLNSFFTSAKPPFLFETSLIEQVLGKWKKKKPDEDIPFPRSKEEEDDDIFVLSDDRLKEISLGYFDKYISELKEIDDSLLSLFEVNYNFKHTYVIKKLRDFIDENDFQKNLINKIIYSVNSSNLDENNSYNFKLELIKQIFHNIESFENYIYALKEDAFLKEFKEFYEKTKNNSFRPVEYNFKKINL